MERKSKLPRKSWECVKENSVSERERERAEREDGGNADVAWERDS